MSSITMILFCVLTATGMSIGATVLLILSQKKQQQALSLLQAQLEKSEQRSIQQLHQLQLELQERYQSGQHHIQTKFTESQHSNQHAIRESIHQQMTDVREQMSHSFKHHATSLTTHLQSLTEEIRSHLNGVSQQVSQRLNEGFEKTSSTFTDIVKRLTIIDEAQKKIAELSTHVVSLQDVLVDKRARGAFGEVQLAALIANMLPSNHYSLQHTLSNQKRADCVLFLPAPTGNLVIDAKFPLETYQKIMNTERTSAERKNLQQQFRQDLQKHIKDIAEKYIIPHETADSALMFIPAEAIFSEVHANYPEVIALSQRLKVWLVSPSTLMAVLTTARAVLKDDATKKQVHIIQQHLHALSGDFQRFGKRMDKLTKHIDQAQQDATEVNLSAKKITNRFSKIESVELDSIATPHATPLEASQSEI